MAVERGSSGRKLKWSWRALLPSRREAAPAHGPWLQLARDYLLAQGAHLHAEEASHIVADLPEGAQVAYTDAPDLLRDDALLLVPGSAMATQIVADIEARSRIGALRLTPAHDALALASTFSIAPTQGTTRSQRDADNRSSSSHQERALILHWEKPPARTVVTRVWERASVEVEYRVGGRDHLGRIADTMRVALDPATGAERPALALAEATAAQSQPLTPADRNMLKTVLAHLDERLRPDLESAASFLRLRSEAEYRRRIEMVSGVAERARREQPEEARQTEQALKREITALGAVFAVEVDCAVAAAWVVHTPMAAVAYHLPGAATVEVTLDLGRGAADPFTCATCQRATREATICAHAHVLCPACRDLTKDACAICVGDRIPAATKAASRSPARQVARVVPNDSAAELTLEGLARLWPSLWQACVGWLLAQQRYTVQGLMSDATEARWRGVDADGQDVFVRALRGDPAERISERDVAKTARLAGEQRLERAVLLAAGSPTRSALVAAGAGNMRIVDGAALRAQLAAFAGHADRQQASAQAETKARARAAMSAQAAMGKALATAATHLAMQPGKARVVGSATLTKARNQLRAARISTDQAFLAWETLLADWFEAFGSAPAHDSSLPLLADADEYKGLHERAVHLGAALADLLREMAATPADGEMGYGAWRTAVVEEARLRRVALEARLRIIDTAQWADFDAARTPAREAAAAQAEVAASRASARADKAQSQVTQLAG